MTPPALQTVAASKWYGQVIAVNDVSLSVPGGVVGLLGPNGAGKSTLLKLLVGLLRPSRGEVRVLGQRAWDNPPLYRRIGYCPEHEGTYEDLTALELVTALTELHGYPYIDARRRAEAVLDELDLAGDMHRRLAEFSKGMRQRAKLAQALAHEPEVLFLDEPLTGCDPLARVRVIEALRARARAGCCLLVSSHVLHEIEALTANILLIDHGQVLAEGDLYQIRALIDAHPHQVRVECDRPRQLGCALATAAHVVRLQFEDGAVVIETREPDRLYSAIPEAARAAGTLVTALTSPDNNLQSVFRYLTAPKSRDGAGA
jgi:ABC-2 type transport system ATP-binding protein